MSEFVIESWTKTGWMFVYGCDNLDDAKAALKHRRCTNPYIKYRLTQHGQDHGS